MIQDIDGNLWILVLEFLDLSNFEWKCETGIIEFMQEWLVVIDSIRVTTLVDWMDMGEDTVQEA